MLEKEDIDELNPFADFFKLRAVTMPKTENTLNDTVYANNSMGV